MVKRCLKQKSAVFAELFEAISLRKRISNSPENGIVATAFTVNGLKVCTSVFIAIGVRQLMKTSLNMMPTLQIGCASVLLTKLGPAPGFLGRPEITTPGMVFRVTLGLLMGGRRCLWGIRGG